MRGNNYNNGGSKQKILIVDDHPANLVVLETLLEDLDIEIIKATSGRDALSMLLQHDIAVVLLDVMMPEMDGYEVAALMKGNKQTRNIPIIFITAANEDKKHTFRGYRAGAVDFLYKPVEPEILISKVSVFIELNRQKQELKQMADMLSQSEEKYKRIIETTDDAVFIADASNGIIIEANNMAEKMLGLPRERIIGMHQRELHPQREAQKYEEIFRESILKGKASLEYLLVVNKDGVEIPVDIRANVIQLGERVIIAGFFRDVTLRKIAEDELKSYRDHLIEMVQVRTSELKALNFRLEAEVEFRKTMEGVLKQQTIELTRSNGELENFAYIASHDLQEPLRKVKSFAELLQNRYQGALDEKADKFIYYIVDGTHRMQRLINDLLVYSRVGINQKKITEPVDLSEALKSALLNLQRLIEETQSRITYDSLPVVLADESQMIQLFQNLIGNAIKFRGQEQPSIHVSAKKTTCEPIRGFTTGERKVWQFTVTDNGIGIKPENYERIFLMFHRLHGRGEYEGTGIGLAICKKVVERHGGRIWVESGQNEGTSFCFTLYDTDSIYS